ncbi:MAG: AbrB/MazE/SpoVT family DNA-binding domain-containing protein [Caldilineaceae bacterium]|nr:AbrB/MazE/SpoVT family DNA-binding domain-containing protein [Caldilineaceae bacterium]
MTEYREYIGTITSKGQVTIPAAVRRLLGVNAADKLLFRIVDGKVEIGPLPMSLDEAFASVKPLNTPENFTKIERIAQEEREARYVNRSRE